MIIGDRVLYTKKEDDKGISTNYMAKITGFAPSGKVWITYLFHDNGIPKIRKISVNDRSISHRKYMEQYDTHLDELMMQDTLHV